MTFSWPVDPERAREYPEDCARIVGLVDWLTPQQAAALWQAYSSSMFASWLLLPKNDEVLFAIIEGAAAGYELGATQ